MFYSNLPTLARHIRRTHTTFAGTYADNALSVLGDMHKAMMDNPSIVGITFPAFIYGDGVELNTEITITRLPEGGWDCVERIPE